MRRYYFCFFVDKNPLTFKHEPPMKKLQGQITKRLVAAMLATVAVIGLSAIAIQAPTQNQNSLTRSLKSIQTDKATLFYPGDDNRQARSHCVEMVLPGTSESKAATENLKLIAAAF
jgi:hypothetical protein